MYELSFLLFFNFHFHIFWTLFFLRIKTKLNANHNLICWCGMLNISYHPDFMFHKTGKAHPERKERLESVLDVFDSKNVWDTTNEIGAYNVDNEILELIHSSGYIEKIENFCKKGGGSLGPDTDVGSFSFKAAKRAVGAGIKLSEKAIREQKDGFGLVRPPGHHAKIGEAMGFCLFNNLAICAETALETQQRVAIVDFDVHHGNGHQDVFFDRKDVLYLSIHQHPHFPNTGRMNMTGKGSGDGYNINMPLGAGKGDVDYEYVFETLFLPILEQYSPDLVLVSAGYDAHELDNFSGMCLSNEAFESMAKEISGLEVPTVCLLEGGYNTEVLPDSILATLRGFGVMVDYDIEVDRVEQEISEETKQKVNEIKKKLTRWF
ncbi:histone deacetylase [archaeon SCG-AAA382B04]|nr:histone deacetylase [archaeon SCG-AAA382B04]